MALGRAEMSIEEASDAWFIDHFRSSGSRCRGDYETTLRRWLSVFPSGQLLLLRYEEVCHAPLRLLSRCAVHLGVSLDPFAELPSSVLSERVFEGPRHALRPSLLRVLTELYRERIESFGNYAGLDVSDWLVKP